MKLIIAGGRDFDDRDLLYTNVYAVHRAVEITEVVCGQARGADSIGEDWAELHGIKVVPFPADWDKYNKAAGPIRNTQMAHYADMLLAFWDGKSKGTGHMINTMTALKKPTTVVYYYAD
jgi:hypothetical protein